MSLWHFYLLKTQCCSSSVAGQLCYDYISTSCSIYVYFNFFGLMVVNLQRKCGCVRARVCVLSLVNKVQFDTYLCCLLKGKSKVLLGPVGNIPVLNLETERRLFLSSLSAFTPYFLPPLFISFLFSSEWFLPRFSPLSAALSSLSQHL